MKFSQNMLNDPARLQSWKSQNGIRRDSTPDLKAYAIQSRLHKSLRDRISSDNRLEIAHELGTDVFELENLVERAPFKLSQVRVEKALDLLKTKGTLAALKSMRGGQDE